VKRTALKTSAYALLAGLAATSALAQESGSDPESTQESARTLETVTITATKRAESLQDVSISVIATSGKEIEDLAITKAEDLTANLPAITISQNPIGNFVYIRGIGTPGANQGIEQSVSMFHDGIYMGRHQLTRAPFMDLERVEVLRGPQSVFFGKNTIGGAVHVITAKPTDTFEASLSGLYGSHGETELLGVISGPLTDRLRGRLAVRQYEMDGYLKNVMTKQDGPAREDTTVRAQLEFDATDNLTIRAKYEKSDFNQVQQSTQLGVTNPFTAGAAAVSGLNQALVAAATGGTGIEYYDDERAVVNDGGVLLSQVAPGFAGLPGFPDLPEKSDNSMDVGILTIDWDLGGHTLTAITGLAQYDYRDICDCDFAALPLIQVDASEDYEQFSQEIRLVSAPGEHFDYIVGAYYHDSDLTFNSVESFGSALAFQQVGVPTPLLVPNLTRDYVFRQKQDQWAIFGSGTWHITDTTRAIVGLRYYEENKTADHVLDKRFTDGWDYSALVSAPAGTIAYGDTAADYDAFLAGFGTTDLGGGVTPGFITEAVYGGLLGTFEHDIRGRKRSENNVDWSLTAEHDFTSDIMGYATVATGTKGGGFDARFLRTNTNPFFEYEEESATNYELGLKSRLFDGSMTFNVAAFFEEIEDFQVSIFDGATAFFVDNAAKVESKGIEVDLRWAATDHLTISAAGSLLDAKYADFRTAPCWAGTDVDNRGDCVDRGLASARRDASGDSVAFAPDFSANLNFNYVRPVTKSLEGRAVLNFNYSDGYFIAADLDPIYGYQPDFTKVDLRLAVGDMNDRWEIALIGKNLTDELTSSNNNDQPLVPGNGFFQTDRPRSVAIQAKVNF
jgi:iron complex outermembrane receptor protein